MISKEKKIFHEVDGSRNRHENQLKLIRRSKWWLNKPKTWKSMHEFNPKSKHSKIKQW